MKKIKLFFYAGILSVFCAVFCVAYAAAESENNHNKSFWRENSGGSYTLGIDASQKGSVWKSNGRIEIVDGNDTIAFDPEDLKIIGEELRAINDDNIVQKKALARTMIEMATQLNQAIDQYGGDSSHKIDVNGIDMNNPDVSVLENISEQLSNYYSNYHYLISSEMNELKKSVADGKASIASAITGKGVSTAADASFATMAGNIDKISATLKRTSIGTGSSDSVRTFSATSIPNYTSLNTTNFVVSVGSLTHVTTGGFSESVGNLTTGLNYNASTGILTVPESFVKSYYNSNGHDFDKSYVSYTVYCYYIG